MDHLCNFCLVFTTLSRLFIAAFWPPPGKGLTSWLSFVVLNLVLVTFPCCIQDQVWYLIVSIPDLCPLSYFEILIGYWQYENMLSSPPLLEILASTG